MTTVTVKMGSCGNDSIVTVKKNLEGKFDITIETTCQNVIAYRTLVPSVSMEDIMGIKESKISAYETTRVLTPSCLVPSAVMTAAWIEIGMIPPEHMRERKMNCVCFDNV